MTASPSPRRALGAGSEIDAWCTRCKMDLGHRIVAMVQTEPKRVLCQTCGSEHNFRPAKADMVQAPAKKRLPARATSTGKTATKSPAKTRTAAHAKVEWETRVRSGKPFRRYTITETFSIDDLVTHKKFGEGYVVALGEGAKLTIAFSDGEKTLVHAVNG